MGPGRANAPCRPFLPLMDFLQRQEDIRNVEREIVVFNELFVIVSQSMGAPRGSSYSLVKAGAGIFGVASRRRVLGEMA